MLLIRKIHAYLGLLIAPSVLFFACSGALQIFSLHEAHGAYRPPALIRSLANLHKDQVVVEPDEHHGPPPGAGARKPDADRQGGPPDDDDHDQPKMTVSTLVLKLFLEGVAAGLVASTLLGLWIGLRTTRTPRLSWSVLAAGVAIPLLIVLV